MVYDHIVVVNGVWYDAGDEVPSTTIKANEIPEHKAEEETTIEKPIKRGRPTKN